MESATPYLEVQSRRDDLKVAQDVSPGYYKFGMSSPGRDG